MKLTTVAQTAAAALLLQPAYGSSEYHRQHWNEWREKQFLQRSGSCCNALHYALGDKLSYPGSTPYDQSLASYWSVQEESVHPNCVFSPRSTEDVAHAARILFEGGKVYPGKCNYAVRSGGHTPFASSANIENGVTIDLAKLNQITLSSDRKSITIGPGNRWVDVYQNLVPQGLVTSGGRVSIVGVGGLTLGGGVSFFSPRKGFVCDTVTRFEVVLPCGDVVNATQHQYSDLWQALKGGSNNFGIVTAIEQESFEQGDFWGGFIGNGPNTFDAQFKAFEHLAGSDNYDEYASLINSYVYTPQTNTWYSASNFEYTKPQPYPPFFKEFTDLPQTFNTMRISNLTDFTNELAASNPIGRRQLFVTQTYRNSAEMMKSIYELANETVQELRSVPKLAYSLSFQPDPPIITTKAASKGGNSLGLDGSEGPLFNVLLTITWDTIKDDDLIDRQAKKLFAEAAVKAKELNVENKYIYLNYAAKWQDPIDGYGQDVKSRLQRVSKKYDPEGVFQTQVPGGFKLFV